MARRSLNTLVSPPFAPAQDNPDLWSNKQAMLFARKKGWNHKDRKALFIKAVELGLEVSPFTVPASLIRSIAANLAAHGGL